jgi:hypothetical protein
LEKKMNVKNLIATVAVLSATGSVFAQTGEYIESAPFVSTKTRAEVIAELNQAYADGTLNVPEYGYPVLQATSEPKSRDEVRAEAVEYLNTHPNGVVDSIYSGS